MWKSSYQAVLKTLSHRLTCDNRCPFFILLGFFELFLILFFQRGKKKTALFFPHQLGKKYLKLLLQQSHLSGLVRWYQQSVDQHWLRSTLRMHHNCSRQHSSLKVLNIYQLENQPKAFISNQKFNKLLIYYGVNTSTAAEQSMFNIQNLSATLLCSLH